MWIHEHYSNVARRKTGSICGWCISVRASGWPGRRHAARRNAFGLLMSLPSVNMLIETPGGCDDTGAQCSQWMREAGFRKISVHPLLGPDSIVVGIK